MKIALTSNTRRSQRSQFFAVFMFVILYVGQPALAFVTTATGPPPCSVRGESCCCVKKVETPKKSCCKPTQSDEEAPEQKCKCRMAPGEFPDQDPALPLSSSSPAGETALDYWVRVHAEISSCVLCGPSSMHDPPRVRDGTAGRVPRLHQDSLTRQKSSLGAWMLAIRGVAGLLAVLSVCRV